MEKDLNQIQEDKDKDKEKNIKFKVPKELQQQYNKTFYDKHKGEKIICPQCFYPYSVFNKSHHLKSKFHLQIIKILGN
jgi:hypothetical protein